MEQLDVRVFLYVYRARHNALIHDVCFTKAETKLPSSSVQETNGWVNFIWVLDVLVWDRMRAKWILNISQPQGLAHTLLTVQTQKVEHWKNRNKTNKGHGIGKNMS